MPASCGNNIPFQAVVKVDYDYNDPGAHTYAPVASPNDLYDVSSNADLYAFDRFIRVGGTLAYTFDDGTVLKSVTGYQHGLTKQKSDSDGTAIGNLTLEYRALEDIVSQEFNLISPDDRRFKYVLGAYYSDDTVHLPTFLISVPPTGIGIASELKRRIAQPLPISRDVTQNFRLNSAAAIIILSCGRI